MFTTEQGNLIKLTDLDDDFIIDLKYASANNFTGHKIYASNQCYMDQHTAAILIRAKNIFKKHGYRVKILDAYRPISAQEKFWELMPNEDYIAKPPTLLKTVVLRPTHLNGLCVDVTLTDMNGEDVEMPSQFDEFSPRSSLLCPDTVGKPREHAQFLKDVMESVGFQAYDMEWWHFYDVSTPPTPPMNFQI